MIKRKKLVEKINMYFATISSYIKLDNTNHCFDINIYCEELFCGLLNKVYNLQLENLNKIQVNFPAVDLGDYTKRTCYQVTSSTEKKKIKETVGKFIEKQLDKDFDELNILILGVKKSYKNGVDTEGSSLKFDINKNVIDLIGLAEYIYTLDKEKIQEILIYLEDNIEAIPNRRKKESYLEGTEERKAKLPASCKRFLKYCRVDDKEHAMLIVRDLKVFIEKFQQFDTNTLEVIYAILKRRISMDESGVYFNDLQVKKFLNIEQEVLYKEFRLLIDNGYIDLANDSGADHDRLRYWTEDGDWEVFNDLIKYCEKQGLDLKRMVVDLDFTLLD